MVFILQTPSFFKVTSKAGYQKVTLKNQDHVFLLGKARVFAPSAGGPRGIGSSTEARPRTRIFRRLGPKGDQAPEVDMSVMQDSASYKP